MLGMLIRRVDDEPHPSGGRVGRIRLRLQSRIRRHVLRRLRLQLMQRAALLCIPQPTHTRGVPTVLPPRAAGSRVVGIRRLLLNGIQQPPVLPRLLDHAPPLGADEEAAHQVLYLARRLVPLPPNHQPPVHARVVDQSTPHQTHRPPPPPHLQATDRREDLVPIERLRRLRRLRRRRIPQLVELPRRDLEAPDGLEAIREAQPALPQPPESLAAGARPS